MVQTPDPTSAPVVLDWGIKSSLVRYVSDMPDGVVEVLEPARATGRGFRFPVDDRSSRVGEGGTLRFSGAVILTGHGGLLRLAITEPWLVPDGSGGAGRLLTIADPYEPGRRIAFATIERLDINGTAMERGAEPGDGAESGSAPGTAPGTALAASGTRLTADGADLFFSGPYTEGTELDDPRILTDA